MPPLSGRWVVDETSLFAPGFRRADRPRLEATATVRTDVVEHVVDTCRSSIHEPPSCGQCAFLIRAVRDAQSEGAIDPAEDAGQLAFEVEAALFLANVQYVVARTSRTDRTGAQDDRAPTRLGRRLVAALPIGRKQLRVVVRAEPYADVPEPEEPHACSVGRRRDVHDEVAPLRLEPPVPVRALACVAERPTLAGSPSRGAHRRMLFPPRCRGPLDEEHESRLVRSNKQRTGAGGVAAEDGGGEPLGYVTLHRRGRCAHPGRPAASGDREREQQTADQTAYRAQ